MIHIACGIDLGKLVLDHGKEAEFNDWCTRFNLVNDDCTGVRQDVVLRWVAWALDLISPADREVYTALKLLDSRPVTVENARALICVLKTSAGTNLLLGPSCAFSSEDLQRRLEDPEIKTTRRHIVNACSKAYGIYSSSFPDVCFQHTSVHALLTRGYPYALQAITDLRGQTLTNSVWRTADVTTTSLGSQLCVDRL